MADLSDKMPAQSPASQDSRMPSTMQSDRPPFKAEGGSDDAPQTPIDQGNPTQAEWESFDDDKVGWQTQDKKLATGSGWEMTDRREDSDLGGRPQRDEDDTIEEE